MAKKEMWKVVGAGPERLRLVNGETVVVSRHSEPFEPAKDTHFQNLKRTGRLSKVMVEGESQGTSVDEDVHEPLTEEPVEESAESDEMVEPNEGEESSEDETPLEDAEQNDPVGIPVGDLGLTSRIETALLEAGIETVEDLTCLTAEELKVLEGIGDRSVKDIGEVLAIMDLSLRIDE